MAMKRHGCSALLAFTVARRSILSGTTSSLDFELHKSPTLCFPVPPQSTRKKYIKIQRALTGEIMSYDMSGYPSLVRSMIKISGVARRVSEPTFVTTVAWTSHKSAQHSARSKNISKWILE